MNRLVLIGNGFDLAHGLKTKYEHFIEWYWEDWGRRLLRGQGKKESDGLCSFTLKDILYLNSWADVWGRRYQRNNPFEPWNLKDVIEIAKEDKELCEFKYIGSFLQNINNSIETKKWVDIENEYYELLTKYSLEENNDTKVKELNEQLHLLQDLLIEYLTMENQKEVKPIESIKSAIYSPFNPYDISLGGSHAIQDHIEGGLALDDHGWRLKLEEYGFDIPAAFRDIQDFKKVYQDNQERIIRHSKDIYYIIYPHFGCPKYLLPNKIMLLNFNYTKTAELYCSEDKDIFSINQIHGEVSRPEGVIFGYGDEMDEKYKELVNKNDNQCLGNIKSIKYLESNNYREVLSFIESEPYQILIMGHSCGNSDRTLLNTLFEHKNCVSIKPYYHKISEEKDNYIEIVQNIGRNFKDMKLMRDRVVNKLYCEPLT